MAGQAAGDNRSLTVNNAYKSQIYQKKVAKVNTLKLKGESKKYKRGLLGKLFKEDIEEATEQRKIEFEFAFAKYSQIVNNKNAKEESKIEAAKEELTPVNVWQQIDEGDMSDLRPDEIPDRALSDVDSLVIDESLEGDSGNQAGKLDNVARM